MSAKNLIGLIVGALIVFQVGCCACAPSPAIPSVQDKELIKTDSSDQIPPQTTAVSSTISAPQHPLNSLLQQEPVKQQFVKVNSAEKLKRGLSNFVNQLTPGSFFVPSPVQHQVQLKHQKYPQVEEQQVGRVESASALGEELNAAKTSAGKSDIVNGQVVADAQIKRSSKLSQARSIGGPLRWG